MRLATFHPTRSGGAGAQQRPDTTPEETPNQTPNETEISVARAGGSADANIARWAGQFEGGPAPKRTDEKIHGLDVTVVEMSGTYSGGAMMPGVAATPHAGWTLVGAIARPQGGATYFFKLLGPTAKVHEVRPSFDTFLASLTPR
jgi:hypothetical protein